MHETRQSRERRNQISVTIEPSLREALARAAAAEQRTVSNHVRHLVTRALADRRTEGARFHD